MLSRRHTIGSCFYVFLLALESVDWDKCKRIRIFVVDKVLFSPLFFTVKSTVFFSNIIKIRVSRQIS